MNPGSFTDRHTPTRPTMPAARGEESERARERCTCIYNKVKSYWGPTNTTIRDRLVGERRRLLTLQIDYSCW